MAASAPARLPSIAALPGLPQAQQNEVLDLLFEPSPAIHQLLLPLLQQQQDSEPLLASYDDLITRAHAVFSALRAESSAAAANAERSDAAERVKLLHSILGSHPRLGAKKVESAQSVAEQAQLQSGDGTELANLNAEYEKTFPGLRYVVFVNGRERPVIMDNMRARIARADIGLEEQEGIQAMCDIARDRAAKLQRP
ncbi:unnamed protein product [Parascedosporium putredinis]|uniref:Oxo-4-hydroxy-4-carboxy-5-ureidoimidazoline decarboxylase domain-containing protein n=1 Tax=Parascedosporium putredinis TaxID=1442378 RepID=A0A9P1MDK3_9PEZI|nr:unnamed protein product [Parascedosporium putredinis]CAI8002812.1 unnamed protein product [Parascedosporium putredinis]